MKYYHGSTTENLKVLIPFSSPYSNLDEAVVYLTTSRQLALHYIWDSTKLTSRMPMLDIKDDGVLVFQEMFSGALEYFYKGLSGYIYHCEGTLNENNNSGVHTCVTSNTIVPVIKSEYISDVYNEIMKYEKSGKLIYERYETLPQYRKDMIRCQVLRLIKHFNLLHDLDNPNISFYKEKFSSYWKEAEVLDENNLL